MGAITWLTFGLLGLFFQKTWHSKKNTFKTIWTLGFSDFSCFFLTYTPIYIFQWSSRVQGLYEKHGLFQLPFPQDLEQHKQPGILYQSLANYAGYVLMHQQLYIDFWVIWNFIILKYVSIINKYIYIYLCIYVINIYIYTCTYTCVIVCRLVFSWFGCKGMSSCMPKKNCCAQSCRITRFFDMLSQEYTKGSRLIRLLFWMALEFWHIHQTGLERAGKTPSSLD